MAKFLSKLLLISAYIAVPFFLHSLTADEIIRKVDDNQVYTTQKFSAVMIIERGNRTLRKEFFGYGREGEEAAFMEFTNPEDKGVKYLKIADELWIYFPDADDVMKISGHMLRQGMMGSDISYEDLLENEALRDSYESVLVGETNVNDVLCYHIELNAKVDDVAYERRTVYIDKARFIPLRIELYARGGRLLKTMEQSNVRRIGNRYVPTKIEVRDMRRRNSVTFIEFTEIEYDIRVPNEVFTLRYLRR
jgi:outer membrane lipoprotein-sorting protein